MSDSLPQVFQFKTAQVRVVMQGENPWFMASDVCSALDLSGDPGQHVRSLDEDEKGLITIQTLGGPQSVAILSEPGLYSLVLRSRKPEAKEFKRWVTHEVLPSIRKSGSYALVPKSLPEALRLYADEVEKREAAEKERLLLAEKIKADEPVLNFGRAVSNSTGAVTIGDFAKICFANGIPVGRNRLFDWLKENGYLIADGRSNNSPYQRFVEQGLFKTKECHVQTDHGEKLRTTTLITGKGQAYFLPKLQASFSTLPIQPAS